MEFRGVLCWVRYFFFYILKIFQKLYLINLILRYLQVIQALSLLLLLLQSSQKNINQILFEINRWFQSNLLLLNYDTTYFMQFLTKKNTELDIQVSFTNKHITNIHSTIFLGLSIDTSMSWKDHVQELTAKLNKACCAIRSIKLLVSLNVVRMIYFCYVHSIISYGYFILG